MTVMCRHGYSLQLSGMSAHPYIITNGHAGAPARFDHQHTASEHAPSSLDHLI